MDVTDVLDRIADRETRKARIAGDTRLWFEALADESAELRVGRCSPPRVVLPATRASTGTRAGTIFGWSGWRGSFTHAQLTQMVNNRAFPEGRVLDQQCMVYRYRFVDRPDAYIGSATGRTTLRGRIGEEVILGPRGRVQPGPRMPRGLAQIVSLLARPERRTGFRFDVGTIVPPGVRNSQNVFILEKSLQAREQPSGNPLSVRSFDEDLYM